jgi:hypothetical protein
VEGSGGRQGSFSECCARLSVTGGSIARNYAVQNFLIYLLALGGLFYALRSREPVYFLLLVHIAYFVAFHNAINVQYRFICPIMPCMILLAGLPVYVWWLKRERRLQPGFASPGPGRVQS